MIRTLLTASLLLAMSVPAHADVTPFPASFRTKDIAVDGAKIHTRIGGKGPAVVLLHGFGDTGDMWAPLAADLAKDHTLVIAGAGHWLMEEAPVGTTQAIRRFIAQ
ncbi:exported hypothetical protein [Pseudomonas sp. IT-P2]|uniref:alpha/beta fold hydrolase n=1 Tax=Pseudomonas sp. IT-P2 TaxID=3026456 RepID=UPI0039E1F805